MSEKTRILIADDSVLFTEALAELLEQHPHITVAGIARTGVEAVRMVETLKPDLITMDVHMPEMDGLEAVEQIMGQRPTPIMVLTADEKSRDQSWGFEALRRGALDLMSKPDIDAIYEASGSEFCERLRLLANIPVIHHPKKRQKVIPTLVPPMPSRTDHIPAVVGIAASTGGPSALAEVLGALPANYPLPIAVVQHLADGFAPHLADWLRDLCALKVQIAQLGAMIEPGVVLIAPEGKHLTIDPDGRVTLVRDDRAQHCPSGDELLSSIASSFQDRSIGIVLTGMGRDGSRGLLKIRKSGGVTVAQDGESSVVDGMPKAARDNGAASEVLPLNQIATFLLHKAMAFTSASGRRHR